MKQETRIDSRPGLFRYRPDYRAIDELKENYIFFPSSDKLNDPFDASPNLFKLSEDPELLKQVILKMREDLAKKIHIKDVDRYLIENYGSLDKAYKELSEGIKGFVLKHGIACFCTTPANPLLWSFYTNNFKGVVMEFDVTQDSEMFDHRLKPVDYVTELKLQEVNPFDDVSFLDKLYEKQIIWSGEGEIRLIKPQTGKHKFNPKCLKSISIGHNATKEFRDEIIQIADEKYPDIEIHDVEIAQNFYGFTLNQLKRNKNPRNTRKPGEK